MLIVKQFSIKDDFQDYFNEKFQRKESEMVILKFLIKQWLKIEKKRKRMEREREREGKNSEMNFRDLAAMVTRICFVWLKITWCEWTRSEVGKPICLFRISVWSDTHLLRGRDTWPFIITGWINYYLWLSVDGYMVISNRISLKDTSLELISKSVKYFTTLIYLFIYFLFFFEQ